MPKFLGEDVTLVGRILSVGDIVDDFTVINNQLQTVKLSDFPAKYKVISVVPSLDTGVCDAQTRRINQELANKPGFIVLTISNDLPFAQRRWCGAIDIDNVITLSDYRDLDFAYKFGTLIKEYRLQTRAIFVIDENNQVLYVEYCDNINSHPNYDQLLAFVAQLK